MLSSDPKERGFPTPNRHKIAGSIVGGADMDNCDRSVTSAKSNENAKSGAFTGSSNSHAGASFTGGAERPTMSGNGIKSLQSTAKKNRIIINDDLRSQHKMQQQLANQDNPAKPLSFSRQQQRVLRHGREDDILDDSVALSSPKVGGGPESRIGVRPLNQAAQAGSTLNKHGDQGSSENLRGKTLNVIVSDLTASLGHK
jgi:hypothetical protein